jgi:hypothetical protein
MLPPVLTQRFRRKPLHLELGGAVSLDTGSDTRPLSSGRSRSERNEGLLVCFKADRIEGAIR